MSDQNLKLVVAVARTYNSLFSAIEKSLVPHGLNISEFGVLEYLLHKGEQPVQRIAEKILVTSGTITYVINKLQNKGYVDRKQCESDRRIYYISLTPVGKALISDLFKEHEQFLDALFEEMPEKDKSTLITSLIQLQSTMNKLSLQHDHKLGL